MAAQPSRNPRCLLFIPREVEPNVLLCPDIVSVIVPTRIKNKTWEADMFQKEPRKIPKTNETNR